MFEDSDDYEDIDDYPYYAPKCSCGEYMVGVLIQCDKHHGIGCYCNDCMM